jgi:hypothetical protein
MRAMLRFVVVALIAFSSFAAAAGTVTPPARAANTDGGASVINGFTCVPLVYVPGIGYLVGTDSHAVNTPSGNGTVVCRYNLPVGPPQTFVADGFDCSNYGLTKIGTGHLVVTPSGQATFTCQVR